VVIQSDFAPDAEGVIRPAFPASLNRLKGNTGLIQGRAQREHEGGRPDLKPRRVGSFNHDAEDGWDAPCQAVSALKARSVDPPNVRNAARQMWGQLGALGGDGRAKRLAALSLVRRMM
jgi:hypothetical protein